MPSLLERVKALLASPATLKEISSRLADMATALGAIQDVQKTGDALRLHIGVLQAQLETLRLEGEATRETGAALRRDLQALRRDLQVLRLQVEWMKARQTTYVGSGVAVTYLEDETPIYVNSHDFGGSVIELINGGRYEPNNLEVLFSFLRPESVFLDIGANVGFFSLQVAKRLKKPGRVISFEPHPDLFHLLCTSAFLNGLSSADGKAGIINVLNIGASDQRRAVTFNYPVGHLGGGTLMNVGDRPHTTVPAHVYPLDKVLPRDLICDLVKIDVEGHELNVLRGMQGILQRSPDIKIIFEKLGVGDGDEREVGAFLQKLGFNLFQIDPDARLAPLDEESLPEASGYLVATRDVPDSLDRRKFRIYPQQFSTTSGIVQDQPKTVLDVSGPAGDTLFFGPFWFLQRGTYRVRLQGLIAGEIMVGIASRTGIHEVEFHLNATQLEAVVVVPNDIFRFECVARPTSEMGGVSLEYLEWIRQS